MKKMIILFLGLIISPQLFSSYLLSSGRQSEFVIFQYKDKNYYIGYGEKIRTDNGRSVETSIHFFEMDDKPNEGYDKICSDAIHIKGRKIVPFMKAVDMHFVMYHHFKASGVVNLKFGDLPSIKPQYLENGNIILGFYMVSGVTINCIMDNICIETYHIEIKYDEKRNTFVVVDSNRSVRIVNVMKYE